MFFIQNVIKIFRAELKKRVGRVTGNKQLFFRPNSHKQSDNFGENV